MAAGQLLLSGYRPLAFVLQQSLYFLMPLALLLGFSPTPVVLGREDEYACAANGAEESQ